jgi:dipeptidyl aminopeptidase/acylaminoacyl peptidase
MALIAIANKQGGSGIAKIDLSSGQRQWLWEKKCFLSSFSRDQSGRFAALIETPDRPPDIYIGENNGKPNSEHSISWNIITNLNSKRAAKFKIGITEEVHWVGQDGLNLQGLLITPPDAPDGPLPTVMLVHGGPTNCDRFRYQPLWRWAQLIACRGFAVFQPNYRGSTGWGLDFAESNIGDMGGADFQDMLAGLDYLILEGRVDHDRLGIAGSSYGGFTTMWAVTQTDRFRAAVSIAGISDWRSFHGRSYLHTWDRIHYGDSDPYSPNSKHAQFSPIAHITNVRTPSLILHGELDWDVPVEQSYQFYRGLKDLGVQAELVVYPREPHGLTEKAHLLDAARRIPDWFEYWITN